MLATDCDLLRLELEQSPSDQTLRLAWADALRERGDPLADGVEALARNGKWAFENPLLTKPSEFLWGSADSHIENPGGSYPTTVHAPVRCRLPLDWFRATCPTGIWWTGWGRRSFAEADLFAAAGFLKLPPARQRELLGR